MALDLSRKLLITGGSGTLGYNVISQLAREGTFKVFAPVRTVRAFLQRLGPTVEFIPHDLQDEQATSRLLERIKPDVIVHCAASGVRPPRSEWFEMIGFNVAGSVALFKAYCALPKSVRFVYISTGLVYRVQQRPLREDDPVGTLHPYGAGKAAADSLLLSAAAVRKNNHGSTPVRIHRNTGWKRALVSWTVASGGCTAAVLPDAWRADSGLLRGRGCCARRDHLCQAETKGAD